MAQYVANRCHGPQWRTGAISPTIRQLAPAGTSWLFSAAGYIRGEATRGAIYGYDGMMLFHLDERGHLLDDLGRIRYYAPYQITNNGANIRRIKQRIAALPRVAEQETAFEETQGDGWRIYAEDNRLCIAFAERTSKELYKALRSHGFVWSPSRNAFVRKFSNQAIHWARHIVGAVDS